MEITEVRIKLMEDNSGSNERLQAFCSITFDDMFVIRDLKIIEGAKGFFVAMPSRKLTDRCHNCGTKNHLRSRFCNQCGCRLDENRAIRDADGRAKLHADIAHPINSMCREKIQAAVLASYADELERSKLPGYVSRYDDLDAEYDHARSRPLARRPVGTRRASRRSGAARSAATPSTREATSRCSAGPTSRPRKESPPRASPPTAAISATASATALSQIGSRRVSIAHRPGRVDVAHSQSPVTAGGVGLLAGSADAAFVPVACLSVAADSGTTTMAAMLSSWSHRCSNPIVPQAFTHGPGSGGRVIAPLAACWPWSSTLGILVVLSALQIRLIFPGSETQGQARRPSSSPGAGTELVNLTTEHDDKIVALFGPALLPNGNPHPEAEPPADAPLLLRQRDVPERRDVRIRALPPARSERHDPRFVGYGMSAGKPARPAAATRPTPPSPTFRDARTSTPRRSSPPAGRSAAPWRSTLRRGSRWPG